LSFSDRSQLNLCRPLAGVTKRKADADTDTAPASQNGYRGLCRSGDHLFKSRNALGELCRFERLHKRIKQLRDFTGICGSVVRTESAPRFPLTRA
jgi:hypothetical protein